MYAPRADAPVARAAPRPTAATSQAAPTAAPTFCAMAPAPRPACSIRVPRPPLADRVERAWSAGTVFTRVADVELALGSDLLVADQQERGFVPMGPATPVLRALGPEGRLEVQLNPERKAYSKAASQPAHGGACACPFCSPSDERQRALLWRDLRVFANPFPYTTDAGGHLVVSTSQHQLQQFSPRMFDDLVDLQRLLGGPTLHYNGLAGNSQEHLHWHVTRERLPLQRMLDDDELSLTPVRKDADVAVATFDDGLFVGLLVTGDKRGVARQAARIVAFLDDDATTQGRYNMLMLPPKNGALRLVIVPRRAEHVAVRTEQLGVLKLGAFDMAGRAVLSRGELPHRGVEALVDARQKTSVAPRELPWLDALAKAPAQDVLALRRAA